MRQEIHACDGIRLPFDTVCRLLDDNRHDILERATQAVLETRPDEDASQAPARVVTAPLKRNGDRSATMAAHWIQPDPMAEAEGGLSAWVHCHLMLLPRQSGDQLITEVLLTARSETSPPEPDRFTDELCARFLHEVLTEIQRRAPLQLLPN